MAILACPNCGKKITDRVKQCPHCGTTLRTDPKPVTDTKETLAAAVKDGLIGILGSVVLTLAVYWLWAKFAGFSLVRYYGDNALAAFMWSKILFDGVLNKILLIEAVILFVFYLIFGRKEGLRLIFGILFTVIFGVVGYVVQRHGIWQDGVVAESMAYAQALIPGFGLAFPVLAGSLFLIGNKRTWIKNVLLPLGLSILFLVLAVVFGYLMVSVLDMGMYGISIANLISAIVVFAVAILTDKGFRRWIHLKI